MRYHYICMIAALCTAVVAVSCAEPHNTETDVDKSNDNNSFEDISNKEILDSNAIIFDTNTNESVYLCDYLVDSSLSVYNYTAIDLNSDGTCEMVIQLAKGTTEYWGSLILHSDQEKVYAHEFTYRSFYDLKADGTFMYSAGASDYGIAKMDFISDSYTILPIVYCESTEDQDIAYIINGNIASKDQFDIYISEQIDKAVADWQEFTSLMPTTE